jgi:hypothetical protein
MSQSDWAWITAYCNHFYIVFQRLNRKTERHVTRALWQARYSWSPD